MLAAVLKGDLAIEQSIYIMRAFKEMRHFIRRNQQFISGAELDFKIQIQSLLAMTEKSISVILN